MELDLDRRCHFHGFTLKYIRPVFPVFHSVKAGFSQNRVSAHNLEVDYLSFFIKCGLQNHIALNSFVPGLSGIAWLHIGEFCGSPPHARICAALLASLVGQFAPMPVLPWP